MVPDGAGLERLDASTSEWHSIRPWTPRLVLSVREITSVSATFILSSSLSHVPSLASLGLADEDDDDEDEDDGTHDTQESSSPKKHTIISDALAKGLSVNVNGTPWQRVLIRIDDKTDEAVIILYGLMPGRQYDIDLGLVQGGQISGSNNVNLRKQVITEDSELPAAEAQTERDSSSAPPSGNYASSPISTSPNRTQPPTPFISPSASPSTHTVTIPTTAAVTTTTAQQITLEDHLAQLQHTLSLLTVERDSLSTSLKAARRDAQKADAALRVEIDVLKRASEKHAAAEHRARQKVLALQEAVKRASSATKVVVSGAKTVEDELPGLLERKEEKETEYMKVKDEVERKGREIGDEVEKERRKVEGMRGELTSLENRVERLGTKRGRLETVVLPDLEERLREVEMERERAERDPYNHADAVHGDGTAESDLHTSGEGSGVAGSSVYDGEDMTRNQTGPPKLTPQRQRPGPGTIGRPAPAPIQRPSTNIAAPSIWTPIPARQNAHRSSGSLPLQVTHQHHQQLPQRHSSLKTSPPGSESTSGSGSGSSPTPVTAISTLSSRAPPFEPARALRNGYSLGSGNGGPGPGYSIMQRPAGATGPRMSALGKWSGYAATGRGT